MTTTTATRDRAVILAAGLGSRLADGRLIPKPLREVAGVPLIVHIIRGLEEGGVREIGIVIGHLGDELRTGLLRHPHRAQLTFFQNDEYEKPNGTSLLKARDFVTGPTFLLMSDHLWSPQLLSSVGSCPISDEESVLGVDYRIDACFDLDDATKVQIRRDRIVRIGKELGEYNALDTGVFLITPALIAALDAVNGPAGCSLSQGVATLAMEGRMKAADVGDGRWIDVDTPEAHAEAERLMAEFGEEMASRRSDSPTQTGVFPRLGRRAERASRIKKVPER